MICSNEVADKGHYHYGTGTVGIYDPRGIVLAVKNEGEVDWIKTMGSPFSG
jgi:hypothetical protein